MSENIKFWATFILALIGALSWIPQIFKKMRKSRIKGKIISIYKNTSSDKKEMVLLFKLSVISRNKDFFLEDIDLKIRFSSSDYITCTSRNWRLLVFNIGYSSKASFKKLNVSDNQFLNNLSVLKGNTPEVGYLSFLINYDKDEPIEEIEFIFKSYENNSKRTLKFAKEDIKKEKLVFDDSIWSDVSAIDYILKANK